ncbi:hypothetical protein CLV32_2397 [Pedobacter duraquae]|uniref:Uncharacterized protein n=1 Tax=Pedobacter duraquae TaxID=425511 RepID=A0A4R6IG15_9SPHI|nr:hypothetical protein CLV32_2397 [Pedobacter duraquae]
MHTDDKNKCFLILVVGDVLVARARKPRMDSVILLKLANVYLIIWDWLEFCTAFPVAAEE